MRTRIMLTGAVLILCGVPILSASESGPCRSVGARSIVCLPPRGTSARRAVSSRAVGAATSAAACELDKISTGVTVKSSAQNLASNNTVGSGGQGKASDLEACPGSASTGEKRTRSTRRCQHLEGCEAAPGLVIYGDANDGVQRCPPLGTRRPALRSFGQLVPTPKMGCSRERTPFCRLD